MSKHPKRLLLPCPFCGGEPLLQDIAGVWTIECRECGSQSAIRENLQSAIAAWNRRVAVAAGTPRSHQAKPEAVSGPDYRARK